MKMKLKANNYFLKSFEEMKLIEKHFDVYDEEGKLLFANCYINENGYVCTGSNELWSITMGLLTGLYYYEIISQQKKLRDWTLEEFVKWKERHNCFNCNECIFNNVYCRIDSSRNWVNHKELYSDKFLNQEIVVEE